MPGRRRLPAAVVEAADRVADPAAVVPAVPVVLAWRVGRGARAVRDAVAVQVAAVVQVAATPPAAAGAIQQVTIANLPAIVSNACSHSFLPECRRYSATSARLPPPVPAQPLPDPRSSPTRNTLEPGHDPGNAVCVKDDHVGRVVLQIGIEPIP